MRIEVFQAGMGYSLTSYLQHAYSIQVDEVQVGRLVKNFPKNDPFGCLPPLLVNGACIVRGCPVLLVHKIITSADH